MSLIPAHTVAVEALYTVTRAYDAAGGDLGSPERLEAGRILSNPQMSWYPHHVAETGRALLRRIKNA